MENIIEAIITAIGIIISTVLSSTILGAAKYKFNTPKTRSILEHQYSDIFVPIHKLIYLEEGTVQQKINNSVEIIRNNYEYAPIKLIKYLSDEKEELIEKENIRQEYCDYISNTLMILRKKLGYELSKKTNENELISKFDKESSTSEDPNPPNGGSGKNPNEEKKTKTVVGSKGKRGKKRALKSKIKENIPLALENTINADKTEVHLKASRNIYTGSKSDLQRIKMRRTLQEFSAKLNDYFQEELARKARKYAYFQEELEREENNNVC